MNQLEALGIGPESFWASVLIFLVAGALGLWTWRGFKTDQEERNRSAEELLESIDGIVEGARSIKRQYEDLLKATSDTTTDVELITLSDISDLPLYGPGKAWIPELEEVDVRKVLPTSHWWPTWGAGFVAGLIPSILVLTGTVLTAINDDEVPDCSAYASTLLELHREAPSTGAAITAAEALDWGAVEEVCGSPGAFLTPLGSE